MRIQWVYSEEEGRKRRRRRQGRRQNVTRLKRKQRQTFVNIVIMWVMTMITIVILDELLLWVRCRQLRREAREAMNRLIEVLETQNNEHLYSTIL